jgi:hypothetical protein
MELILGIAFLVYLFKGRDSAIGVLKFFGKVAGLIFVIVFLIAFGTGGS